ncbi:MAG TPA: N-acetylmuramoyl-L-alanine amidase [Longimicrobiales bacterium]|nr:N-acetylmuramoyl-L-alanine amidase [Longimicrobiales bacterium]
MADRRALSQIMRPVLALGTVLVAGAFVAFSPGGATPRAVPGEPALDGPTGPELAPMAAADTSRDRTGPVRIALQAGHWRAAEAPDEQAGLRANGTRAAGVAEWEVNLAIATRAARLLEDAGYEVEILPTTIPPAYRADLFISIHADGNPNTTVSGYRAAAPRRDRTGLASDFAALLNSEYGAVTGLPFYPTLTRRMTSYYAFNSRRYTHALDPATPGVILETGFLTSPRDRRVIVDAPERAAAGIVAAVLKFLPPPVVADASEPGDRSP